MKNIRIVCLAVISYLALSDLFAQEKLFDVLPLKEGKVTYSNVIYVDSVSQEELYQRAKRWLSITYDVIKYYDRDELIARGYFKCKNLYVWQTISIKIKDSRYKYEFMDFTIIASINSTRKGLNGAGTSIEYYNKTKMYSEDIDKEVNNIVESLKNAIAIPVDNNW
jgi:hypothetical protein